MVDSFTTTRFSGNPAGVLYPADDLDDETMIALAGELGASESAFIYRQREGEAQWRIRFFSRKQEMAVCTHATVAAFHILAERYGLGRIHHTMESAGGTFAVTVRESDSDHPSVSLIQRGKGMRGIIGPMLAPMLQAALGLGDQDLVDGQFSVVYEAGTAKILVEVATKEALDSIKIEKETLIRLGEMMRCPGFFCYTYEGCEAGVSVNARMFSPGTGVDEDPATGNAAAAHALFLRQRGMLEDGTPIVYAQGEAMGRKGYVTVTVTGKRAEIFGRAVTVWQGSILL